jgi:hypothetical protein
MFIKSLVFTSPILMFVRLCILFKMSFPLLVLHGLLLELISAQSGSALQYIVVKLHENNVMICSLKGL